MCNIWGCVKFPHVVTTRSTGAEFGAEIDEWNRERGLRLANTNGSGDFLMIISRVGENYVYAFKDPELAMLFKLTWG